MKILPIIIAVACILACYAMSKAILGPDIDYDHMPFLAQAVIKTLFGAMTLMLVAGLLTCAYLIGRAIINL